MAPGMQLYDMHQHLYAHPELSRCAAESISKFWRSTAVGRPSKGRHHMKKAKCRPGEE